MPVIINQSDDRVLLRFNSGVTRTLGPREELEVEHVEVKANPRIQHLESRRRIEVRREEAGGGRARARPRGAARAPQAGAANEGGGAGAKDEGGSGEAKPARRPRPQRRRAKPEE